jgi:GntR family transcriptional regulator, transcriptional repressor for pyruvate dehydrogenase complex
MLKRQSLSVEVATDIKDKIVKGALKPGAQIQTEAELCRNYEVSRTVVREAISRLRSEGLLVALQGVGVFVSNSGGTKRFEVDWDSIRTLPDTLSLLELRLAIEVESAGLCAQRRSAADARGIRQAMERANRQVKSLERTNLHYDFDFHLAIARGSKNPHFYELLQFLKPIIVPRIRLSALVKEDTKESYELHIRDEHEDVVAAIEAQDENGARESMRSHLTKSLDRLRSLAASYGVRQQKGEEGELFETALSGFVQGIRVAAERS